MIPLWIRKLLKRKQTTAEIIELIKDLKVGEELNIYCCDWGRYKESKYVYRSELCGCTCLARKKELIEVPIKKTWVKSNACQTIYHTRARIPAVYGAGMFTTTHVNKKAAITRISEERQTR